MDFDNGPINPETGQYERYQTLPKNALETAKPVRPIRQSYRHTKCQAITSMSWPIAMTYAVQPSYYTHTFCATCKEHRPVSEFKWLDDGTEVGS